MIKIVSVRRRRLASASGYYYNLTVTDCVSGATDRDSLPVQRGGTGIIKGPRGWLFREKVCRIRGGRFNAIPACARARLYVCARVFMCVICTRKMRWDVSFMRSVYAGCLVEFWGCFYGSARNTVVSCTVFFCVGAWEDWKVYRLAGNSQKGLEKTKKGLMVSFLKIWFFRSRNSLPWSLDDFEMNTFCNIFWWM